MKTIFAAILGLAAGVALAEPPSFSGIYPSLAYFNNEGECGTGAVVPWAGKLWVISYGPHLPTGSSDKLYSLDDKLNETIHPESIGGTPANRMIHRESQQLFIGPYAIDDKGGVRAISYKVMPGRLTGNARHLTDPAGKIYFATMEEGLYEVDVKTLDVAGFIRDGNFKKPLPGEKHPAQIDSQLPGYHGKGLYSGQGRVVYANNGERGDIQNPTIPSGALAEWRGEGDWQLVRRNQFTEVTGPGGIYGNANPATDPIWSVGWDFRSVILALLDGGKWTFYRLPKASHAYDGSHGWNTEWPRIRDIGPEGHPELMMTMHGMFWKFPKTFSLANAAGIRPRSAYLKVVGDFCRWNDRIVIGCDDSAKSEFLNKRKVKGGIQGPGQSQSNLWFVDPATPDQLGPATAEGAVWIRDPVKIGDVSEPFLFAGWENRGAYFVNGGDAPMTFALEVDEKGNGEWKKLRDVKLGANDSTWTEFSAAEAGEWIRVKAARDCAAATVHFAYAAKDRREAKPDAIFDGLAQIGDGKSMAGLVRARGEDKRSLAFVAMNVENNAATETGYYELDADAKLKKVDDEKARDFTKKSVAIPKNVITVEESSVLVVDDKGRRWRLPKGDPKFDAATDAGVLRIAREVATERDVFQACGTFYELPAENADGFAKIRPISSHNFAPMDYCSYRGMLILTGIGAGDAKNPHIIRSEDGKAALWAGVIDDLWKLGKPVGHGGPLKNSAVNAGKPSDPYLIGFYDKRTFSLSHDAKDAVTFKIEVDPAGMGTWVSYKMITVAPGKTETLELPASLSARWLRATSSADCTATAQLVYE